jgi:outer membrane cobalamin receptor
MSLMAPSVLALLLALGQFGQSNTGELRVTVTDSSGFPLPGPVQVVSEANEFSQRIETDSAGVAIVRRLPFGAYRVAVTRTGFANVSRLVEIRSALPAEYHVTMSVATVQAQITVSAETTLLDPHQATSVHRIGAETLERRTSALPGRALPDMVNTQPGWLLEANGILHPRGSEYQTQYVIDGLPLTDNRSPAFAPEIDADDVHAMTVLTGGYPAEYGRKLGGVIEVVTAGETRRGFHGSAAGSIGSFSTKGIDALGGYSWPRTTVSAGAGVAGTDRYLDPPVEENFTNHGTTSRAMVHIEHNLTATDRFGVILRAGDVRFLVPNERVQQDAGQRQERHSQETVAQFSYQHVFSVPLVADLRGMARDLSATLGSNAGATPMIVGQDHGIRDGYLKGSMAAHFGIHEVKVGGDVNVGTVREQFAYQLTDAGQFDPGTPAAFDFHDRRSDVEQAMFVQDQIRAGRWTVNAGIRWDHYRVVVDERAISPRLGVAWSWPDAGLVLRASYDRAFQTPAIENLLLASSAAVDALSENVIRLPVRPSRGNFYEVAASKVLFRAVRLDANYFERHMTDFADDDLLLNTGVSFPIAFERGDIHGTEVTLDVPHWKRMSGSISYAHQRGVGQLPITGGLFLGDEGASLLDSTDRFPVSQDQRHTMRSRLNCQVTASTWAGVSAGYGSGLPVEFTGDKALAVEQYGPRIVDRVDFESGRVRATLSLDASIGIALVKTSRHRLVLQIGGRNLTNRLNLINFAGLFSGTALATPRSLAVRVRADF